MIASQPWVEHFPATTVFRRRQRLVLERLGRRPRHAAERGHEGSHRGWPPAPVESNSAIARRLAVSRPTVIMWRQRFAPAGRRRSPRCGPAVPQGHNPGRQGQGDHRGHHPDDTPRTDPLELSQHGQSAGRERGHGAAHLGTLTAWQPPTLHRASSSSPTTRSFFEQAQAM